MAMIDMFRALGEWWPLRQKANQYPIILQFTTNPLVLVGSAAGSASIELPGDCDLQIDDWTCWTSDPLFPDSTSFRTSIYYGSGDWAINYPANNGVRGECLFGTAQRPGRIGYRPWEISTYGNRGILTFNVTNLSTGTITIEIQLRGHRRSR